MKLQINSGKRRNKDATNLQKDLKYIGVDMDDMSAAMAIFNL